MSRANEQSTLRSSELAAREAPSKERTTRIRRLARKRHLIGMGCMGLVFSLQLTATPLWAQAVSQADVQVTSLEIRRSYSATDAYDVKVRVFSYWDDDASNAEMYVFLPPATSVIALPWNLSCSAVEGF